MKQEIGIIREPIKTKYPNGKTYTYDVACDVCDRVNYPIFTWATGDDPYVDAGICFECVTEMMHQNST